MNLFLKTILVALPLAVGFSGALMSTEAAAQSRDGGDRGGGGRDGGGSSDNSEPRRTPECHTWEQCSPGRDIPEREPPRRKQSVKSTECEATPVLVQTRYGTHTEMRCRIDTVGRM